MKALIVRLSALGDVACTLPAAGSLKVGFPDCELTWLVDKRFAGVVECCEWVDRVVVAEKGFSAIKKQVSELGEFDVALDLQGLLKSALPVAMVRAETKLGYHWQREGAAFLVGKVWPDPQSIHVVDQYVDVARAAGGKECREFGLKPKEEDESVVDAVLAEAGYEGGRPLVLSNAGAGWAAKRWPAVNYARLVSSVEGAGGQVGFIGTKADEEAFQGVVDAGAPQALNLLGKTNVRQLVALLNRANVMVAGDTGALHIAAGLGRPCVGIYTQTNPERSCAYGQLENCRETDPDAVIGRVLSLLGAGS